MRLPVAVFTALLALPASAGASVVGLEGTQLVLRADPGERVSLMSGFNSAHVLFFSGRSVRPGPGCVSGRDGVECAPGGVTGVTIVTGDGDDTVGHYGHLPLTLTLGAGNDTFQGQSQAVTVDAGPGDDRGLLEVSQAGNVTGGDGDDRLDLHLGDHGQGPFVVDGGAGDDALTVLHDGPYAARPGGLRPGLAGPVAVACGPGADRWSAGPYDVPGDGCAPTMTGITTRTVARAFREGALTGRASGSVTLRRLTDLGRGRERIARGTFAAGAGPLRVSLRPTATGRDRLRRNPRLPVLVSVRTRRGAERGEIVFASRMSGR